MAIVQPVETAHRVEMQDHHVEMAVVVKATDEEIWATYRDEETFEQPVATIRPGYGPGMVVEGCPL